MADLLYLSYWLRGFNEANMLSSLGRALKMFPFSRAAQGVSTFRIYALEFAEPPLVETYYDEPADLETILSAAAEFRAADCAYFAGVYWDLWQREKDWSLAPAPAVVACHGAEFASDIGDHLRVELGLDFHFLPRPGLPSSVPLVKSNIRSVLRLARELEQVLPVERRRLWTESGEDFAERLSSLLV